MRRAQLGINGLVVGILWCLFFNPSGTNGNPGRLWVQPGVSRLCAVGGFPLPWSIPLQNHCSDGECGGWRWCESCWSTLALVAAAATWECLIATGLRVVSLKCPSFVVHVGMSECNCSSLSGWDLSDVVDVLDEFDDVNEQMNLDTDEVSYDYFIKHFERVVVIGSVYVCLRYVKSHT